MKTLRDRERCQVLLERDGTPSAVRWRNRSWGVKAVLDVWVLWSRWWAAGGLEGETEVHWLLATSRGEVEVLEVAHPDPGRRGWFVEGWND